MLEVNVTGEQISEAEKNAYIERAIQKNKNKALIGLDIHIDGEYAERKYRFAPQPFDRIRRITGYLVGGMDRWNDAKRAEESERVKHSVAPVDPGFAPSETVDLPQNGTAN